MKIILIITYIFLGEFPATLVIQVPDMETCEAVKAHMMRIEPPSIYAEFKCVDESKS